MTRDEQLAEAIHEEYVKSELAKGETVASKPSLVSWDELPETLRDSCRAQARDIPDKLERIACRVEVLDGPGAAFAFTDDEVDRLAEVEHERWWLDRVIDGWTWGEHKSTTARTHPDLVPWAALGARVQDVDRDAVRAIPRVLASAGLQVVRIADTVAPPDELLALLDTCVPAFVALRPRLGAFGDALTTMLRELARARHPPRSSPGGSRARPASSTRSSASIPSTTIRCATSRISVGFV